MRQRCIQLVHLFWSSAFLWAKNPCNTLFAAQLDVRITRHINLYLLQSGIKMRNINSMKVEQTLCPKGNFAAIAVE